MRFVATLATLATLSSLLVASPAFAQPGVSVDADAGGRLLADLTAAQLVAQGLEVYDASWLPVNERPEFSLTVDGGVIGSHVQLRNAQGTIVARFEFDSAMNTDTLRAQAVDAATRVARFLASESAAAR